MATWTDEQSDFAAELWQRGLSAREIANLLNDRFGTEYTRMSVIGRMYRTQKNHSAKFHLKERGKVPPKGCQWIHGDPQGDYSYCGNPGHPWCSEHRAVVYETKEQREEAREWWQTHNTDKLKWGNAGFV